MAIPSWLWSNAETLERDGRRECEPSDGDAVSPVVAGSPSVSASPRDAARATTRAIDTETIANEDGSHTRTRARTRPRSFDFEDLSSDLDALANPIRLEILTALARCDAPLRYSELRAAISIEDNGKLNYHLRTLEDLVTNVDGEYRLTARGRDLVGRVLEDVSTRPDTRTSQDR